MADDEVDPDDLSRKVIPSNLQAFLKVRPCSPNRISRS
jgi:hypothetical protein